MSEVFSLNKSFIFLSIQKGNIQKKFSLVNKTDVNNHNNMK